MENTLKISGVLADPTRFYIYQYIAKSLREMTVQDIATEFQIHPNVARLHLTKLEDVNLIVSTTEKSGKGGRPSRLYRLSNDLVQLYFPFRDYQLLSNIALEALTKLGEPGKVALFETGKKFGENIILQEIVSRGRQIHDFTIDEKISVFKNSLSTAGLSPHFEKAVNQDKYYIGVQNCPFKEVQTGCASCVCGMHIEFIRGMAETLFTSVTLENTAVIGPNNKVCKYELTFS